MLFLECFGNIILPFICSCIIYGIFRDCLSLRNSRAVRVFFFIVLFILSYPVVLPGETTATLGIFVFLYLSVLLFFTDRFIVKTAVVLILYPVWMSFYYLDYNAGYIVWVYVFGRDMPVFWENAMIAFLAAFKIPFLIFIHRLVGKWLKPDEMNLPWNVWAMISIVSLASFFGIITLIFQVDEPGTYIIWPACIACILTNMGICYICSFIARSVRISMEADIMRTQQSYYADLKRERNEIYALRHEMKNHLSIIQSLVKHDEKKQTEEYLSGLLREFSSSLKRFCENETVNALLNAKYRTASEKNIECDFMVELPGDPGIDIVRLCAVIANTLDNAIEGSCRIEDSGRRKVTVKGRYTDSSFSYFIENNISAEPAGSEGDFKTTKKDTKLHGYGMGIIRDMVSAMNGTAEIKCDDSRFSVTVFIPVKSQESVYDL